MVAAHRRRPLQAGGARSAAVTVKAVPFPVSRDGQARSRVGLPNSIATLLAAQTTFGAAKMVLETGYHPALLKDAVTTPAGCTIDGILELEEGGLRVTLIKAVMRATQRAKELAG